VPSSRTSRLGGTAYGVAVHRPGRRRAPRKWDRGSFLILTFFGLFLAVVGAVYASYLFDPKTTATVQSCHTESTGGRGKLYTTWCDVTFEWQGKEHSAEAELPKPLPEGSHTEIRVHAADDIENVQTSAHFAWLLPLGVLLLVPPYVWGWPPSKRR
jgi:hypothetical protein